MKRSQFYVLWTMPYALIALILFGIVVAYQRPFSMPLNIGREEGFNNDLPFLRDFNDSEKLPDTQMRYRWSKPESALFFENLPRRVHVLELAQIAGNPATLHFGDVRFQGLSAGRRIHVLIPVQVSSNLTIKITSEQLHGADDPRELAASFSGGALTGLGNATPPLQPLLAWAVMLGAMAVLVALLGGSQHEALGLISVTGLGAIAATWFAPLRVGYSASAIMQTTLYGMGFAGLLWLMLPYVCQRLHLTISDQALRWLIIISVAVFALKLWGRMLPYSMPGDIGFHRNRVLMAIFGEPFNPSKHRGIPFPYPPVLYVLLLPLTQLGFSIEWTIQLAVVVCQALSIPVVWLGMKRITQNERAALWSSLLYGVFAADFMTLAWMFGAHIFVQFVTLVWSVLMICWWGRWHERKIWLVLTIGLLIIALGHFGFYINSTLLVGLLVGWLWLKHDRRQAYALLGMAFVVQCIAWGVFYSSFIELFLQQSRAVASGGINAVNDRPAIARWDLIKDTFTLGFWWHYAVIPVMLAPCGVWLMRKTQQMRLIVGTFIVSLALGIFPIINSTTITTRWLMFSAWAIAATSGIALDWLWQKRWGKSLAILITLIIAAWGLTVWFGAIVYRIRPPEPF